MWPPQGQKKSRLFFALHFTLVDDLSVLYLVDVRAVGVHAIVLYRICLSYIFGIHSISLFHVYHRLFLKR